VSKSTYTEECKTEALKQIMEEGHSVLEVSKAIGVSDVTLYNWLRKTGWKSGESKDIRKLTEAEEENKRLKAEVRK
jgi:transposase